MPPSRTVRYGDGTDQFIEVWAPVDHGEPSNDEAAGTAVLIHGGYWRDRYGLDLMDPMAEHLAGQGWEVWNIEYRRITPTDHDGVWDEMSADVRAAVATADRHQADPSGPLVVIGHSAGGHLALWAAADSLQSLPHPATVTSDGPARGRIDAVVALAPVADLVEADRRDLSDGAARLLLGGSHTEVGDRYQEASPQARLPLGLPQLVIHGDADDAVPLEVSTGYAEAAQSVGDDVRLLTPIGIDHFHVIDPAHTVWQPIQDQLNHWSSTLRRRSIAAPEPGGQSDPGPSRGQGSGDPDFDRISEAIGRFTAERGWDRYHNPKNLLLALVGEVGELSEHFQWLSPAEAASPPPELLADIEDEAADVLIYLIQLARKLDIDLLAAVERKMIKNAEKYPPPDPV